MDYVGEIGVEGGRMDSERPRDAWVRLPGKAMAFSRAWEVRVSLRVWRERVRRLKASSGESARIRQ